MQEQIIDALRRGAADEALAAARQAVADEPANLELQRLLAGALRLKGDVAGALAVLDQALATSPEDAGLHMDRGTLLLADRSQLDEAEAALARSVGLDPNQFPAYILQAQLALARGDLDEANRLARTASRLAPEHPQILGIDGMVALYRGEPETALKLLNLATQRAPGDPSLLPALGFAYAASGHLAFAEQTFRRLLERSPDSLALQTMVADLIRRQGRPGDAADLLAPLAARDDASPGLRRAYARMELQAGRADRALPLITAAFERNPEEVPVVEALVDLWRFGNHIDLARESLDRALAAHPHTEALWRARLLFEPFAGDGARGVVERWLQAMPDHIPALEARATIHDAAGETAQADEIAYQVAALQPGRSSAQLRIVDSLLRRDPKAAVAHVEGLIAQARNPSILLGLRQLLGRTQAAAGEPAAAVATWSQVHVELLPQRLPLPELTDGPTAPLPVQAPPTPGMHGALFLWGPPGSMVESLAATLSAGGAPLLADRNSPRPPNDPLQRSTTAQELVAGRLAPADLVNQWRAALPARGLRTGPVFDWLLWWDNALASALRGHMGEGLVLIAVRDPRDMLLDWLAWGSINSPFGLASPAAGAAWLARSMQQVFELHRSNLCQHVLVPMDTITHNPQALASVVNQTLGLELPPPPPAALGVPRNVPGAWRSFAEPLAEAFALLTPVAVRLGYPQD